MARNPTVISGQGNTYPVNVRCPYCRQMSTFNPVGSHDVIVTRFSETNQQSAFQAGMRRCSNPSCGELLFIEALNYKDILRTYPAEYLDFDPADIPAKIIASFREAITDHAHQCYRSAAIMVRRTLEEVCADKGAEGSDLKKRLLALQSLIVVPAELMQAADELRLLGNDAAHLESRIYDDIGKPEIEAAIDLCKEILKAVYQLGSLIQRLKALKA